MNALIIDAVRTPRGRAKAEGSMAGVKPAALAASALTSLVARSGAQASQVEDVVLGCNTQVDGQGADIARIAALYAGFPDSVSGASVNRFCCSGLDAISSAAARIAAGFDDMIIAGGVESMSQVPMLSDRGAWFSDPEVAARTGWVHMGVAADLVATVHDIDRADTDAYAVRSHARAADARDKGRHAAVMPVTLADGQVVDADEAIRDGMTLDAAAKLPVAFEEMAAGPLGEGVRQRHPEVELSHVHTVASSPALVDAASAVLLASEQAATRSGLVARGRVLASAHAAVDPVIMLTGVVDAIRKALDRAGLTAADIDLWEVNESFAVTPLLVQRTFDIPDERLNVDGGAIAMGHPLGATGGILVSALLDALTERNLHRGIVAIPGGAGVAMALVIERS